MNQLPARISNGAERGELTRRESIGRRNTHLTLQHPSPAGGFVCDLFAKPRKELLNRRAEERAVPERRLQTRLPASPFVAGNLGAAAHSEHGGHLVLREAGALAVGPEVIVEFGAGHCLRRSGSLRATSVMPTD